MADLTPDVPSALKTRGAAERCLYLAAKLSEGGDGDPLAVALVLQILSAEIKGVSDEAKRLVDRWETSMLTHEEASGFIEADPDWLVAVVALLREVSRGRPGRVAV
jgi:hypothetical protein